MVGEWPEGWALEALEDCMSAIIDYRGKSPKKTTFGIPLVTAKIVKGGRILTPEEFIEPDEYHDWMRRGLPEPGDVVMTTEAPLGEIAQLDGKKVALAQRLITLRGRENILDNTYLKFLMQSDSVQEQLKARATGTTVLGIRQSELRKVQLKIPPLSEQKAIAHILGTLDDKIELNRRMNETLEAMARAIFKSWFVDFDPVRAKMDGRKPAGMDDATAALFPDSFVDSELGQVPKGWQVRKLEEMGTIKTGKTPSTKVSKNFGGEVPFLTPSDMDGRKFIFETRRYLTVQGAKVVESAKIPEGAIVVSCIGSDMGKTAIAGKNCVTNQQINSIIPYQRSAGEYLYYNLHGRKAELQLLASGGSAQPILNKSGFSKMTILQPSPSILEAFEEIAKSIAEKVAANFRQIHSLATIRDTLLPKLLSGEIRVSEAEQTVAEVA